jgi:hypothetical protein
MYFHYHLLAAFLAILSFYTFAVAVPSPGLEVQACCTVDCK